MRIPYRISSGPRGWKSIETPPVIAPLVLGIRAGLGVVLLICAVIALFTSFTVFVWTLAAAAIVLPPIKKGGDEK